MERSSALSAAEIVGVAAATAAALGGVIVALGRSQVSEPSPQVDVVVSSTPARLSREGVERGRELAKSAAASLTASYPEILESATDLLHRATDSAKPRASKVTSSASSTAEQVRATGTTVLERLQEDVIPAATTAIAGFMERAGDKQKQVTPATNELKAAAAAKADAALTKSTSAAKESLATLVWAGVAAALVYLVLLNPERREQIKSALWSGIDQVLVLVRDFQGDADEF